MTTYYVKPDGDDSANGLSDANAWRSSRKAAATLVAGDIAYFAPGTYIGRVDQATSGSSGSPIRFVGDIYGQYFADYTPGLVFWTLWRNPTFLHNSGGNCVLRATAQLTFVQWENIYFNGARASSSPTVELDSTDHNWEAIKFLDCAFSSFPGYSGHRGSMALRVDYNSCVTDPAGSEGLIIDGCIFDDKVVLYHRNTATSNWNAKCLITRNIFETWENTAMQIVGDASNTYSIGGIKILGNTFKWCTAGITTDDTHNTANPIEIRSNHFIRVSSIPVSATNATADSVIVSNNINLQQSIQSGDADVTIQTGVNAHADEGGHINGEHVNAMWYKFMGRVLSPPFEIPDLTHGIYSSQGGNLSDKTITDLPTTDFYGRPLYGGVPSRIAVGYLDGTTVAASDPDVAWGSVAGLTDTSETVGPDTSTQGSKSTNYIKAGGVTADFSVSTDSSIKDVYAVVNCDLIDANGAIGIAVYTASEAEELLDDVIDETMSMDLTDENYVAGLKLARPAAGWTMATIEALEVRLWKSDANANNVKVLRVGFDVDCWDEPTIGAVNNVNLPVISSAVQRTGSYAIVFTGAGFHEISIPVVNSIEKTITAYGRYDSNYGGASLPILEVVDVDRSSAGTDAMAGAADTWEQLTVTWTPSLSGWVTIRLRSRDTESGLCYFDDVEVE